MCSFWEDDNFRDRGEFGNSATDGCFSGLNKHKGCHNNFIRNCGFIMKEIGIYF
jgi:hypothetical protein